MTMTMSGCKICNSINLTSFKKDLYDDRYGYPGKFSLIKCLSCNHIFLQEKFLENDVQQLYTMYYPRSSLSLEQYRPYQEVKHITAWFNGLYSSAFRWIPKNVRILDIGCGYGESLGYHQSRGCDVWGVEADENVNSISNKFGYKIHIGLFDQSLYESNFFDYITMDQVIEHIVDVKRVLKDITYVLKPGGRLIITTPNASSLGAKIFQKRWINWHIPYHLHYFSFESMTLASEEAGLQLEKFQTITNSNWLLYQWIHFILFPSQGELSALWFPQKQLSLREKLVINICQGIHSFKFNHLLIRLIDRIGKGDNFIFIFRKPE